MLRAQKILTYAALLQWDYSPELEGMLTLPPPTRSEREWLRSSTHKKASKHFGKTPATRGP